MKKIFSVSLMFFLLFVCKNVQAISMPGGQSAEVCAANQSTATAGCTDTAYDQLVEHVASEEPRFAGCLSELTTCETVTVPGYCETVECPPICAEAAAGEAACMPGCIAACIPKQIELQCHPEARKCATGVCTEMAAEAAENKVHLPFFDVFTMDLGASITRGIQVAIKFFLSDDNEIVAELVYDGKDKGKAPCGGNGGAYTGDNGSAFAPLNAVASSITDIPAEAGAYPEDVQIQKTSVAELAKYRIQSVVQEQAALDQLSADKWAIQYRAQQRAIQAMTDALIMKKAYKELAELGEKASSGSYSNYSEAASTVATRRLLLDALMALRKRVIAARVRARAETMEMDLPDVATAPSVEDGDSASGSATPNTQNTTITTANDNGAPSGYDNAGLNSATDEPEVNTPNENKGEE